MRKPRDTSARAAALAWVAAAAFLAVLWPILVTVAAVFLGLMLLSRLIFGKPYIR